MTQENPLEIQAFLAAPQMQDGDIFVASKDSIEGRDRATLTRIVTADSFQTKEYLSAAIDGLIEFNKIPIEQKIAVLHELQVKLLGSQMETDDQK